MKLHELKPAARSRQGRRRVGRGIAAGQGKTSGRGQKGQGARESNSVPRGFEGGQMPLTMRLPKLRGFHNRFRRQYAVVNLSKLNRFDKDATVDGAALAAAGLVSGPDVPVKLLAAGRIKVAVQVRVHRASAAARAAVEAAGGSVELLDAPAAAVTDDAAAPDTATSDQGGADAPVPDAPAADAQSQTSTPRRRGRKQ